MRNPIAVSSWSLHNKIGISYSNGPGEIEPFRCQDTWGRGTFSVFDLPRELALRGYRRCEICHFHIASQDPVELTKLRRAFEEQGVVIQTLLIDDGDLTAPSSRARDIEWMSGWIRTAALLGAENARVIAGKSKPTAETLALSVDGLKRLLALGQQVGVGVATENWLDLLSTPDSVHHVLDRVPGLGFMADTGNWSGTTKYDDLQSIFGRANLCHAKASFATELAMDEVDFASCLAAAKKAGYSGPLTLIFMDEGDEWAGLEKERVFILRS